MSFPERSERAALKIMKALARGAEFEEIVGPGLARGAPLVHLLMELPELMDRVFAYRTAREAVVAMGGQILREAYSLHLRELAGALNKASPEVRSAVLLEVRAHHRFIEDLALLSKALPQIETLARTALDAEGAKILQRCAQAISEAEEIATPVARAFWNDFRRVVGPEQEQAWAEIVQMAREISVSKAAAAGGRAFEGQISRLQGLLFEHYARLSPRMAGEIDLQLRGCAIRAARLGKGWEPMRLYGEMELAIVGKSDLQALASTGRFPSNPSWKKFADSSVVAARLPSGPNAGLGELDVAALFQFKAEKTGSTGLIRQNVNDLSRAFEGASGKTILARIEIPGPGGSTRKVVCALRPPDLRDPLTYYAIATSNTVIPNTNVLSEMGVNLRKVNLPPSRDDLRKLARLLAVSAAGR